jgi:hypothetical protein
LDGGAVSPNVAMKKATIQGDDLLFEELKTRNGHQQTVIF